MILLDTNVISELLRPAPNSQVVRWFDSQADSSLGTTAITTFELHSGLMAMPPGRRKTALESLLTAILNRAVQERVFSFDREAAQQAAELNADRQRRGHLVEIRDTMIAGIVLATGATLATRNVRHFEEIAGRVVNPWD